MTSTIELTIGPWTTSSLPTSTTLKSVATSKASGLEHTLTSAASRLLTEKDRVELITLSRYFRGASASLDIILAEIENATATVELVKSYATQVIFNATLNINDLIWEENAYEIRRLGRFSNIFYLVIFTIQMCFFVGMMYKSRYHWFNVAFVCGMICEFVGFVSRVYNFSDMTDINGFIAQLVTLTIAPAFIMGGIYYLFAQVVVIHGREFSMLPPMWYSYIFITCDIVSLIIQAGGGGAASVASDQYEDTDPGTYTMITGIAFQVFAMSIFLFFWFAFLMRIYFKHSKHDSGEANSVTSDEEKHQPNYDVSLKKPNLKTFLRLLFNTKSAQQYRALYLEKFYNPQFADIRAKMLFQYFPLAITISVICIYIRCVYRVVELAQGFSGYLITHEVYLMVLDADLVAATGFIYMAFHPVFVFGVVNRLQIAVIKNKKGKNQAEESNIGDTEEEHPDYGDPDAEGDDNDFSKVQSLDRPYLEAYSEDNYEDAATQQYDSTRKEAI